MTDLFTTGQYYLHSKLESDFKINCEALTFRELHALSYIARKLLPRFKAVVGIPTGGLALANELEFFSDEDAEVTLLVDDVLTTGSSMLEYRQRIEGPVSGLVLFARGPCPEWVTPLFTLHPGVTYEV